jgi:hypothetical protein
MVVGGKILSRSGEILRSNERDQHRENAFSLAIRGLVMRITKLYARGSVVSLRMCAEERRERRMSAQHLQEQAISRVLAKHRRHSLGDELTPAILRKRAFPHVPSSAGAEKSAREGGTA